MTFDVNKNKILAHNTLINLQGILVALIILFATLFANFWFTAAYSSYIKSNNIDDPNSSDLAIGSFDHNNNYNSLTLRNITNTVSFTDEVNVNNLPNLTSLKPAVITDPNEQYLTRNYTAYINAKKQDELVRLTSIPTANVIGIQGVNKSSSSTIINTRFEGLSQVCCIPPDIQLAVSSKYVMETVNSEAAIYTKTGNLIKKFGLEFLFNLPSRESSDSHSITDPVLLFDSATNDTQSNSHNNGTNNNDDNRRWFASISDVTTHSIRIAVSKTGDPTGVWRTYNFPFESLPNNCSDQPFITVSDDKLAIGVNTWNNNCDWLNNNNNNNGNLTSSPKFRGVQFVIADKNDFLAEQQLVHIKSMQSVPNTKYFSLRPALNVSPTTAIFLVTADDFNHNKIRILAIDGKLSNLHISKNISGNIHITSISPDGIQPITLSTIDNNSKNTISSRQKGIVTLAKEQHPEYFVHTGDARVQSPIWYKGKLWLALNVGCYINGDTQTRSCIRITEFDTNTSKVLLDFNIGHIGASLYYPALSIDKSGDNLGVIFGYSSSDTYPSLLVGSSSVKNNNTIFKSLKYFQFLKNGTVNSLSTRYGDYFSAAMDPSEPTSIWVAGQYYYYSQSSSALLWSTYIGKINTENTRNLQ
jgi:hypothetical protein